MDETVLMCVDDQGHPILDENRKLIYYCTKSM